MNAQDIIDEVYAKLQIEIKNIDLEISRFDMIRDFCQEFLVDFGVDVDTIVKVQLCQDVSGDDELIPITNLLSSVNAVLPARSIGLFDIISPTKQFMLSFFESSLQYHKFCDSFMTEIFNLCNPMIESKKAQKQLEDEASSLNASTKELIVKTENEKLKLEMARASLNDLNQGINELKDLKLAEDNKLLEIMNEKQIKLRKKQQAVAALNEKKRVLDFLMTKLDRSFNCQEQIEKLKCEASTLQETRRKINSQIDEKKASQVEQTQIKQIFEERCRSIDNIHQSIVKLKTLEDLKKVDASRENAVFQDLDVINNQISKVHEENKIAVEFRQNEIDHLRKTLDRECESSEVYLSKLEGMKKEFKDVEELRRKMVALSEKETKLKESYLREEHRLKTEEEELVKRSKKEHEYYKELAHSIVEKDASFKNIFKEFLD